ncbi:class I SAM-dependent methyltransferase [Nocardia sp. NPDC052566]|uniref:class I SAM-dependent methyltransferase n=1 Tax=Nocardia sp. NPDC052566 TaxID=3364330 RepID=UPI0037C5E36D
MTEMSSSAAPSWPVTPGYRDGLFHGAAQFYAAFRPAYPAALFTDLLARVGEQRGGHLVDLACGTGEIAIPLHGHFTHVQAVDIEPEMIEVGRAKAADVGATDIEWSVGKAEDLHVTAPVQLITVGNAFHRLDRPLIAGKAREWLAPDGCIAVLGSSTPWSGTEAWQAAAVEVIDRWTGHPHRPAGPAVAGGEAPVRLTHEDVLIAAGFEQVAEHRFPTPHTWTLDEFVGFLWSTSIAGPIRETPSTAEGFEAELRDRLLTLEPSGQLQETIAHYYILGHRPTRGDSRSNAHIHVARCY